MAATALFEAAGDVQATLDAAFALIEDCLDPAQGLGAAFLSESSASASSTVLPPTTGGKRKRRAASNTTSSKAASDAPAKKLTFQYRQKEEIQRLRAEAASLETQLNLLQWLSDGSDPPASIPGSKLVAISRAPSRWQLLDMWKSMASRHKKLRVAAENENAILRARVADQLKTIQAIQKLLRRPANHDQIQRIPRPINAIRTDLSEPNSVVLERLCVDLDQMYIDVDKTLQVVGLDGLDVVPIQQRVHQLSPTTSMSLLIESRIMPFNFIETSTTMWDFSLDLCTVTDLFKKQTTVNRQGTILRRYEMEQTEAGTQFVVTGDHALRKYTENERFVAVNSGLARPLRVRGVDTSGVICLERGRVVCSPVGDRTSNLCRVQTCFEVVVEVDKSLKNAAELATDFRDLLVSHKTHMFHTFKNGLESALLRKHRAQLPTSG